MYGKLKFDYRKILKDFPRKRIKLIYNEVIKMTNYEIATGTYREDLVDFNFIKFINERNSHGLNNHMFSIESSIKYSNINEILVDLIKYGLSDLTYTIHTKNIIEFQKPGVFISVFATFDIKSIKIDIYGEKEIITSYFNLLKDKFNHNDLKMSWYYSSRGGMDCADISIMDNFNIVNDVHYPFIKDGVDAYLDKYHNSKSAILLLTGEPGTGKTSFIRHYIHKYKLNSVVTYDETVMQSDTFYISFLTNDKKHVLIVEDADVLLSDRENSGNKIMSKFLNVSDGLVKNMNKKIIFSTNLTQLNKIDPAIIRKGRCYDIIEFRKLTLPEANVVCDRHGLPAFDTGSEFSLADVFNRQQIKTVKRMGF